MYIAEFFPAISIRDLAFGYAEPPVAAVRENFSVDCVVRRLLKSTGLPLHASTISTAENYHFGARGKTVLRLGLRNGRLSNATRFRSQRL